MHVLSRHDSLLDEAEMFLTCKTATERVSCTYYAVSIMPQ